MSRVFYITPIMKIMKIEINRAELQERESIVSSEMLDSMVFWLMQGKNPAQIARIWKVKYSTAYYWFRKAGFDDIVKTRQAMKRFLLSDIAGDKGKTYYSYVKAAFDRGDLDKKGMTRALNSFYQNRKKFTGGADPKIL